MNSPNILLVVLDTARAKTVLPGLRNGLMPALGRLAAEGTTFTNARTTAPWTLPSHASLFSGQYTTDHGTHTGHRRFDPDTPTLANRLRQQGYRTRAISGNIWVSPEFGFDAGFDRFSMKWDLFWDAADLSTTSAADGMYDKARALWGELTPTNVPKTIANALNGNLGGGYDDGARLTTWRATRWLRKQRTTDDPFFFFINYLEPHLEYDPPTGYREKFTAGHDPATLDAINQDPWTYVAGDESMTNADFDGLRGLYEGELDYVDTCLARLYGALADADILDETMVVITSDHGENIGEHGLMDHQYCLYDTLLRVPLVIRYPRRFESGETNDALVELRDLYPTLLDVAGDDPTNLPDTVSNASLVPDSRTGSRTTREFTITEYVKPQPTMDALEQKLGYEPTDADRLNRALRSITSHDWKLIEGDDGSVELYDLAADPNESTDVSADEPEMTANLQRELEARRGPMKRGDAAETGVSDRSRERLADLGYI
jgi:arylsulfatase A-like enzyme